MLITSYHLMTYLEKFDKNLWMSYPYIKPTILSQIKYTVLKIPLAKIVKDSDTQTQIFKAADRLNRITLHLYQFLRLWALNHFTTTGKVPKITKDTIQMAYRAILDTVSCPGRKPSGANKLLLEEFETFFTEHYQPLCGVKSNGRNLTNIINEYMSIDILTNIENNIRCHYSKYINRYVNGHFLDTLEMTTKAEREIRKQVKSQLAAVKRDLMTGKLTSDNKYHFWILEQRQLILPDLTEETHYLGHKVDPQRYLAGMFYMNRKLEELGRKTFQPFPLRRELIPKYLPIDSHALVSLLDLEGKGQYYSELLSSREVIWSAFFKMDHKIFQHKKITFDYRLLTDGLATSLQFVTKSNEEIKMTKKAKMRAGRDKARKIKCGKLVEPTEVETPPNIIPKKQLVEKKRRSDEWKYLENLATEEVKDLKGGFMVCDHGKKNLLYLMNEEGKKLRFTSKERNKFTKLKDFQTKIEKFRRNKGIMRLEAPLREVSGKTSSLEGFEKYIRVKNEVNRNLGNLYNSEIFRKLKWYGYVNRERYISKIIGRIKEFGKKKNGEVRTLIYGDYDGRSHLKGCIPVPGVGLKRKISRQVKVINLDEFRTSALSWTKEEYCGNLVVEENGKRREVHAILTYNGDNNGQGCIGRDLNAVRNMKMLVEFFLEGKGRPLNFRRGVEVSRANYRRFDAMRLNTIDT